LTNRICSIVEQDVPRSLGEATMDTLDNDYATGYGHDLIAGTA
jgi:hypothetical protein